jgi:hypothetical protein
MHAAEASAVARAITASQLVTTGSLREAHGVDNLIVVDHLVSPKANHLNAELLTFDTAFDGSLCCSPHRWIVGLDLDHLCSPGSLLVALCYEREYMRLRINSQEFLRLRINYFWCTFFGTMEQVLLTVPEVADRLGVAPAHVRLLLGQEKLRGQKHGRDWMITAEDFAEFERSYKPTTGRPRSGAKTRKGRPPSQKGKG